MNDNDEIEFNLTKYQASNLSWMFKVAYELGIMDTGDWFGEIINKFKLIANNLHEGNQSIEDGVKWARFNINNKIAYEREKVNRFQERIKVLNGIVEAAISYRDKNNLNTMTDGHSNRLCASLT